MNIVYGGSFNPPTLAHLKIIRLLQEKFNPQNIIVIPVGNSYKQKKLEDGIHRINMLKLMIQNEAIVSDIEIKQNKYLGTYNTLNLLSSYYNDLYFVMGADNIINMKQWINYKELIHKYKFILIDRNEIDIKKYLMENFLNEINNFYILPYKSEISSSLVREDLDKNNFMLDEKVYDYIKKNNLY